MALIDSLKKYRQAQDTLAKVNDWVATHGAQVKRSGIEISIATELSTAPAEFGETIARYVIANRGAVLAFVSAELQQDIDDLEAALLIELQAEIDDINTP